MNTHTLKSYDKQLEVLTNSILEMGALVRQMILLAKRSFGERTEALVAEAVHVDQSINALEREIENQITVILALQNPMAIDLRFVTSALKISSALERAGDLAKNTAKRCIKLGDYNPMGTIKNICTMADVVVSMLDDALTAVKNSDATQALDVWKRDDQVDDMYHQILTSVQQEMLSNPEHVLTGTHLVFAAKNFERIADYATNLAKTVHYVLSGEQADKRLLRGDPTSNTTH